MPLHSHRYLAHVDGIRCLAVIPVVLYHLSAGLCPGGFVGVDVFFVISGYLICGGILRDLKANRFTLRSFYYRRIRRIFPAYFVLVGSVLLAGILLYHWARLLPLAQTALFSTAFSTNIYFWLTMGYFRTTSHGNPLLHLWSLGIEEQFYIVAPLALLLLWKLRKSSVMPFIGLGFVLSLLACVVLGRMGESTTAFYILLTRAWELLAGATICALPAAKDTRKARVLGLLGLLLVVGTYWSLNTGGTFDEAGTSVEVLLAGSVSLGIVPFPGLVTIPVILGSVLLIRYGAGGMAGKLLSSGPFVWVGKISYSLYLWHWPIFVFGAYITYGELGPGFGVVALLLSFLCAYASWRWVEMPVRVSERFTMRRAFLGAAVGCGVVSLVCGVLIMTDGLRYQLHRSANRLASAPYPFMPNLEKFSLGEPAFEAVEYPGFDQRYVKRLGDPDLAPHFCLLGDSHADSLAPGMDLVAAESGAAGYYIDRHVDPYVKEGGRAVKFFNWIAGQEEIRDVYIVDRWLHQYDVLDGLPELGDKGSIEEVVLDEGVRKKMETDLRRTVEWWRARGKRVYLFSCVPEYLYSTSDIMARSQIIPQSLPVEITEQDYRNRQAPVARLHASMAEEGLVVLVPLGDAFLEDGETLIRSPEGLPYYRDGDHLTDEGAVRGTRFVAPILWPKDEFREGPESDGA